MMCIHGPLDGCNTSSPVGCSYPELSDFLPWRFCSCTSIINCQSTGVATHFFFDHFYSSNELYGFYFMEHNFFMYAHTCCAEVLRKDQMSWHEFSLISQMFSSRLAGVDWVSVSKTELSMSRDTLLAGLISSGPLLMLSSSKHVSIHLRCM